jgi:GH24 family phage-related lysozyme (muramidase)
VILKTEELTIDFLNYLRRVENAKLFETGEKEYVVHESPEGGLDTVGYGHKLNVLEKQTGQVYGYLIDDIDEETASLILVKDIFRFQDQLNQKERSWKNLTRWQQEMLTDFEFNLGNAEQKFPKFYKAVLRKDIDVMRQEYKRYYTDSESEVHEVRDRNEQFYARYLSPEAVQSWGRGWRYES